MTIASVKFLPSGDTALTVEFGSEIDRELNSQILRLSRSVAAAEIEGVRETVPTYRSLLVHYDPLKLKQTDLKAHLRDIIAASLEDTSHSKIAPQKSHGTHWQIPICFEPDFAPDLAHVADAAGICTEQVIEILLGITHHVYMIGFAPGQPYMGDLPPALNLPRRKTPIPRIEKGSLITATGLTIIYPVANPTGWHVIGRTPIEIFSLNRPQPVLFKAGDSVSFTRILEAEFFALQNKSLNFKLDEFVVSKPKNKAQNTA